MKRLTLFAAWLGVLVLTTLLTWQIVSAADDRVSDRPLAPLDVAAPPVSASATSSTPTTTPAPSSTATTDVPPPTSSSTTTTTPSSSTTSTTVASPTTTSAAAIEWRTRVVETSGGTLVLRYRPGEVAYQSATPATGFRVEVDKKGPPEVEVEFEGHDEKVEVHAAWESGDLKIEISGDSEDHE